MPYITKEHRDQMSQGLIFQLVDKSKRESYSLWDKTQKEFIKEGQVIDINGKTHELKETKWLKTKDFETLLPGFNRNNKTDRTVIINGEEFTYPMPKSVDEGVEGIISTLTAAGIEPVGVNFLVSKTGTLLSTRYKVVMGGAETPTTTPSPQTTVSIQPVVVEETVIDTTSETTAVNKEPLVLTETEQQLVDALTESSVKAGRKYMFDEVKEHFLKRNILEERAKLVWLDNLQ